jgi:hypothetical protein
LTGLKGYLSIIFQLVDRLFEYPVLSIPAAAGFLKVTHRSGAQLIGKLEGTYRLYAAKEVIDTIESSEAQ